VGTQSAATGLGGLRAGPRAIEAKCHDIVFARGIRAGRPIIELEMLLTQVTRVREALALALLDDRGRESELDGALQQLHPRAREVVRAVNRGSRQGDNLGQLTELIRNAQRLVDRLVTR
jgi:hypothetical protein